MAVDRVRHTGFTTPPKQGSLNTPLPDGRGACFLSDTSDDISLVSVLRSPFFAISDITLLEFARTIPKGSSWWAALEDCGEGLRRPRAILAELLRESSRSVPSRLLRIADRLTGYTFVIANLVHGSRREADWRGMQELLRKLEQRGRDDVFSIARHLKHLLASETEIEHLSQEWKRHQMSKNPLENALLTDR